jgi:hypothetical protein
MMADTVAPARSLPPYHLTIGELAHHVKAQMPDVWLFLVILVAACRIPDEHFTAGGGDPATRLIAPLSMSAVTQQKPTLRWVLGRDEGAPAIDLCMDRSCTMPLPVATQLAADHQIRELIRNRR